MEVQLTVRYPDNATTTHRFSEEPITVGSAVANHIVLEEQEVAPHQLIIFREGGGWVVRSLAPEPPIQCEDRPLTPGETRVLGHEACMILGPFVIEWCSEASPVGEAKELARPLAAAAEVGAASAPVSAPIPNADQTAPSLPPDPRERAPEPVMEAADVASAFDLLDGSRSAPSAPSAAPPPAAAAIAPQPMVMASAPACATATLPASPPATVAPPLPEPELAEPQGDHAPPPRAAVEPPVTTAPAAMINPRVTLNAFRRMYPFRAYPLLVNITQPATISDSEPADRAFVRVVPSLPGCLVTPPAARLDLRRAAVGMRFWVTPMVVGRQQDGWIDVAWQGAPPARLKMVYRVVKQWPAKLFATLAVLVVALTYLWEKFPALRPEGLEAKTPEVVQRYLGETVNTVGSVTNLGFCAAGVLLILAIASFVMRRPKSTALTATRARS